MTTSIILLIIISYLIGSIPFSLWIGFLNGQDIRLQGSGNIGATNTARSAGWLAGLIALIFDFLKGCSIYLTVSWLIDNPSDYIWAGAGLAVILGHIFSIFLKGKGGKGIATGAGVFAILLTTELLLAVIVFVLVILTSRTISWGSLLATFTLTITHFVRSELPLNNGHAPMTILVSIVFLLVLIKHRDNINRIKHSEEPQISFKKKPKPKPRFYLDQKVIWSNTGLGKEYAKKYGVETLYIAYLLYDRHAILSCNSSCTGANCLKDEQGNNKLFSLIHLQPVLQNNITVSTITVPSSTNKII